MIDLFEKIILTVSFVLVDVILLSCAGQIYPSGGPPDTTPPEIVESLPLPRTLNFHQQEVSFSFSKYVDRRSVEESIFFSPSVGQLTFDWGSKDVTVHFTDSLRPRTTYIVTLGTDLRDIRNNRLAQAFSLPFSTGNVIDTAKITGSVFDQDPVGVMIFGYKLDDRLPDTLNPSHTKPDYITQTGKDGKFILPYLAFGTYRLIAVRDEYKNLLYDLQTDHFGTFTSDVVLTPVHPIYPGVQFRLSIEDTSAPFLSSAKALDQNHVVLKFSQGMDVSSITIDSMTIVDTLMNAPLSIVNLSFTERPSLEAEVVTAEQKKNAGYRFILNGAQDSAGNKMHFPHNIGEFTGSADPDTAKPVFEISDLHDQSKEIPIDEIFHFQFQKPVKQQSFESGFVMFDTALVKVKGRFVWWFSTAVSFVPLEPLRYETNYRLRVVLDSIRDYSGNHFSDSTLMIRFQTVNEKILSSIRGQITDDLAGAKGTLIVTATNIADRKMKPRTIVLPSPGNFEMDGLKEGQYTFFAFRDADTNGIYSCGRPYPFVPSERFIVYPDTLKLRARWPLEGLTIRLK